MNIQTSSIRVRFAPSPTGHLHIGGLRTALFNWLFARHNKGQFVLRIEDTDSERSKPEFTESILASLAWTGLSSDEPVVIQSQRFKEHLALAHQLVEQGKAYRCYCAPKDVVGRQEEFFVKYDGACRNRPAHKDDAQKSYAIRFKLPTDQQSVTFHDIIRGEVSFDLGQFDDFIIVRSDKVPVYNFVVVIDDAYMRISHVVRGEEHISNTPKQILLYQACGYKLPHFAHLPMILGPSGDKLSKRDGAVSVLEYKQEGYLPDALINYLARLGWAHGDQEIFTRQELIDYFSLDQVGKKGAIFDAQKLAWINAVYIRALSGSAIFDYITHMIPDLLKKLPHWSKESIIQSIDLCKERVHTLKELVQDITTLHDGPSFFNESDINEWINLDTGNQLKKVHELLMKHQDDDMQTITSMIKQLSKELGIKFVELAQPIRIALIGKSSGPGVFELLTLLGIQESCARIQRLRTMIAAGG
jgi:glutamyl-tRNA synthetase